MRINSEFEIISMEGNSPAPHPFVVLRNASTSMTDEVLEREADSLPYGVPLPKPEFAKGSEKGTIREAIVGVRLGESPRSTR
jgi:hypothetical protein